MTNTLFGQSSICISKYKYSASLIISLLTVIVLTPTTMSYINITLFSILILCVSLFYLSRNNVIEGADGDDNNAVDTTPLDRSAVDAIISGFEQVIQANSETITRVIAETTAAANQASLTRLPEARFNSSEPVAFLPYASAVARSFEASITFSNAPN